LLEGLGGKISVTQDLLNSANFNWAYSELFQNYDRNQISAYLPEAIKLSCESGMMVHFAETHDNNRLAARSIPFARMRTALCALCSIQGGFAFANGVEWYATEKINVHEAVSLNWGSEINQVDWIRRLNTILRIHPAFRSQTKIEFVQSGEDNLIILWRCHYPSQKTLLIVVNLDEKNSGSAIWDPLQLKMKGPAYVDLLAGETVSTQIDGSLHGIDLAPLEIRCLSENHKDLDRLEDALKSKGCPAPQIETQILAAKVLEFFRSFNGVCDLGDFDLHQAAADLLDDPAAFCHRFKPQNSAPNVTTWRWPEDSKREVMVPPDHFLIVKAPVSFQACITSRERNLAKEYAVRSNNNTFFAIFSPLRPHRRHRFLDLKLKVFTADECRHAKAPLLLLARPDGMHVRKIFKRAHVRKHTRLYLGTNGRGAMLRANLSWGKLNSRYDALLAANMHPDIPENRHIMFTRCRIWMIFQDYSQEIGDDCLDTFKIGRNSQGIWRYNVPAGRGKQTRLTLKIALTPGKNEVNIHIYRHLREHQSDGPADDQPVQLILRPDIEDRSFHETTKAYTGPEHHFPKCVHQQPNGFVFAPHPDRTLKIVAAPGQFIWEPEWYYMVHRPIEAERGQDPDSDLFSPGYFSIWLAAKDRAKLTAAIEDTSLSAPKINRPVQAVDKKEGDAFLDSLLAALDHYIVRRNDLKSIIAGFPWFLDWGRDALIFVRGLIAADKIDEAGAVLELFGQFEKNGTLPNMICGDDAANRDTSDAQLWLFVACADMLEAQKSNDFLDKLWGSETVRQRLVHIGRSLVAGTDNGIYADTDSKLLFSPAHFTWMDTNFPAGTPRQGYPIEIQALWYFALSFLAGIDTQAPQLPWDELAAQVQDSIMSLYFLPEEGYLCDCLHASTGTAACDAQKDDALRPNQLLAITLGAVIDRRVCAQILSSCEQLLIPGAIRSLAHRPVRHPHPVIHQGKLLNDPQNPYQGRYFGDEDTQRKLAYHNGTAWTWPFPSYCEAWVMTYGESGCETAAAWLKSSIRLIDQGCIGHLPEILDGDFPHHQRGCDAQAWGISELYRVWKKIKAKKILFTDAQL
jgi:starch synthase (maltosyl-transferring)